MHRSRLTLAVAMAVLGLLLVAAPAAAECSVRPGPDEPTPYVFIATVVDVSDDVDPSLPDSAAFDYRIELDVNRLLAGKVPKRVHANGWDVGCGFSGVDKVNVGDRLLIATTSLDATDPRLVLGPVLLWHRVGGHWDFYGEVLQDGEFGYPKAAIRASTTREILRYLETLGAPATSTVSRPAVPVGDSSLPILHIAAVLLAVLAVLRRVGRLA